MAIADLPLPPDLMPEPIPDAGLQALLDAIVELADEAAIDLPVAAVEVLIDPREEGTTGRARRWRPTDDSGAEWCMRHLVAARVELAELGAQADQWAAQIQAWFDHKARSLQAKAAMMDQLLEWYGLLVREASGGKTKTVLLPSGQVRTVGSGAAVVVTAPAEALAWARANLEPAEVREVVKVPEPADPYVLVPPLRKVVAPVLVVDEWRATLTCSCVVPIVGMPSLEPGTGTECPSCGQEALIGRLEATREHWEAQDKAGRRVEGVEVRPPSVTAEVVPNVP